MPVAAITPRNFNLSFQKYYQKVAPIKFHQGIRIFVSIAGVGCCVATGANKAMVTTAAATSSNSNRSGGGGAYTGIKEIVRFEKEIKKSKFIAVAGPISDEQSAQSFLSQVREQRATHNCWAYKVGDQFRSNDDGEPSGTAGKPIHSAIESSGIDRVMVVVIRYFGGIKLGTGGLVRAYGGVASECLKNAPTCLVKSRVRMGVEVPFDLLGVLYHQLQSFHVEDIKQDYETGKDGITMFDIPFQKLGVVKLSAVLLLGLLGSVFDNMLNGTGRLFRFAFVAFPRQNPNFLIQADSTLIQNTCKNTKYYGLCVSSLKSVPTSINADTKGLAVIMVGIGTANATATSSYLSSQLISSSINDTNLKKVLKECADKYGYVGDALQASVQDLGSESYDYAYMHITAAADNPNACHNAFKRYPGLAYPPELARREEGLKHICDVALGIIDNFGL
ncbi:hypothetical protein D8674_013398 [Pyrus ussuriensis x Pyrus communis]|uniref:Pectinesterase inhibitor domain-containing protein n=1 Tax=Pyrus ussuriensis x Pyrus communis TaxID=2448454 RepID=A0A5N5GPQ8_9ROSA|nr:hypothetical protein D8674_013398 [Pyrus ussuriensis x Pyrus communis]